MSYTIFTDSCCDLPAATAAMMGIIALPLHTTIDGKTYADMLDGSGVDIKWFYEKMREKLPATTSAINIDAFINAFEPELAAGRDVLFMGLSSGLSSTYQTGAMAAEELSAKYPERKIYAVDTLGASLGQGLLVYLTAKQREAGATVEEARDYAENTKFHLAHWFTVDDLFHLKRGGRVSAAVAIVGSMLGIKPVLHVDDEGHLINMEKVRGRRKAIERLAEKAVELADDLAEQTVFISHGDCIDEVAILEDKLRELGVKDILVNYVGPVIGTHAGPGTIALFFLGKHR
jgi:DegV family protein with EDD domain